MFVESGVICKHIGYVRGAAAAIVRLVRFYAVLDNLQLTSRMGNARRMGSPTFAQEASVGFMILGWFFKRFGSV